jgi:hypothetical protein
MSARIIQVRPSRNPRWKNFRYFRDGLREASGYLRVGD